MMSNPLTHPTRRGILGGFASLMVWSALPRTALASSGRDPRLVMVILRGGLDGLSAVAPVGDPAYEAARHGFVLPTEGPHGRLPLDGMFALNGRMQHTHALWQAGEALFIQAVHTAYRGRSHFSAQDVLENGTTNEHYDDDGWLGRALAVLPTIGQAAAPAGLAIAANTPLILRGSPEVLTWAPPGYRPADDDTRMRLLALYRHTDPGLAQALEAGLALEGVTGTEADMLAAYQASADSSADAARLKVLDMTAASVGRVLSTEEGPRIGVLDLDGFDTHSQQAAVEGALGKRLAMLDRLVFKLRESLNSVWPDTVMVIATEFGRTVEMNGSRGTDHGSATVAMLLGGAVAGGRVVADWPGLAPQNLFEQRDLMPTTDLRAVLKGVLSDHLGFGPRQLGDGIFPGTGALRPLEGLIRA